MCILRQPCFVYMYIDFVGIYNQLCIQSCAINHACNLPYTNELNGERGKFAHAMVNERFVFDRGCSSNSALPK